MLTSVNMLVSSSCAYQEGCVQATVDGRKLWVSSGLEDFFLGSNFHTMPNYQLPTAGFYLDNSSTINSGGWRNGLPNAVRVVQSFTSLCNVHVCLRASQLMIVTHCMQLSAYRIMNDEPIFFKDSLRFQWQPHGQQASLAATYPISCNRGWPQKEGPVPPPDAHGDMTIGAVSISSLTYVYTWGTS